MNRRLWFTVCFAALLLPATLLAHARLKYSSPADGAKLVAAPSVIELDFSETPELALTTIVLTAPDGSRIPLGALTRSPSSARGVIAVISGRLSGGLYKVSWTTAAEDGHPTQGSFTFAIQMGPGMTGTMPVTMNGAHSIQGDQPAGFGVESPAYVVIRWLQFLALLVVIGAVAFRQLVLSFLKRKEDPDSPMIADAARNAALWGNRAAAVLLLVCVLRLMAQSYMMHGGMGGVAPSMMSSMITRTLWGRGWVLQIVAVAIAGLGFYMARWKDDSRWWRVATVGAVLLAFSPAFAGHASSSPRLTALAISADGLHVMSAGGWLGSLLMVVGVGIPAALRLPTGERGPMVAEVVNAFSPTALVFAGLISGTGVFAAWLHLGSVEALWTTTYGKTLLVKLAILSVVALTGAYNWLRVKPHLGRVEGAARIRRSATIELAVGVLIVLATAVLVALATPHDATLNGSSGSVSAVQAG